MRETDGGGADGSTGTVDLGVAPGLTLAQVAALCNTSGLAVEGETPTMHAGTDQNLPVVHNTHSVSVTGTHAHLSWMSVISYIQLQVTGSYMHICCWC